MTKTFDQAFLRRLRWLGFIEGTSTLLLFFVAMPLKYAAGMPEAVRVVGTVHGFLFLALCWWLWMARERIGLSLQLSLIGMGAAVVPFGPFVYDRYLPREGSPQDAV